MQFNEIYRYGFVVPLDKEAEASCSNEEVNESTKVSYFELDDTLFGQLWVKGFFHQINSALGVNIDEYENETIPLPMLSDLILVVEKCLTELPLGDKEKEVLNSIKDFSIKAQEVQTCLIFVL